MLVHGGGLDSLAVPKAPGATAGFMATPWAAVKAGASSEGGAGALWPNHNH